MFGGERRFNLILSEITMPKRAVQKRHAVKNLSSIPFRSILILQKNWIAHCVDACRAPSIVEENQRVKPGDFRLSWHQLFQQVDQAQGFVAKIGPNVRDVGLRCVSFVKNEVNNSQNIMQPSRQFGKSGNGERDMSLSNFTLCAYQALRYRCRNR